MEQLIDAIKKRAWRSAWLSIVALLKVGMLGFFKAVLSYLKSVGSCFVLGWAFGFGGYFGLSLAFDVDHYLGGNQAVFIDLNPVQVIPVASDGSPKG